MRFLVFFYGLGIFPVGAARHEGGYYRTINIYHDPLRIKVNIMVLFNKGGPRRYPSHLAKSSECASEY